MLPFLPFGWFLWAVTACILTPYIWPIRKFFLWLQTKDKKGFTDKAIERVARLYQWAGDHERSDQMRETFKRRPNADDKSEKTQESPRAKEG
jgi:hypothetical protein